MSSGAANGHTGWLKRIKTRVNIPWQEFGIDMILCGSMMDKLAPVVDCILISQGRYLCKDAGYVQSLFCITHEAVARLDL